MRSLPLLLLSLLACAPPVEGEAECAAASDCGETESVCAGCPELASSLCLEGSCAERPALAVEVRGDVNLDRQVAPRVSSFVHVIVAAITAEGPFSCGAAFEGGRSAPGLNVLTAGYKNVEGGSFHPDVNLGRAPEGPVGVLVLATDDSAGRGEVLASGCLADVEAAAPAHDLGTLAVSP